MAVHNGFDNRFYVIVWERKQDRICTLSFEVWSYFNLFSQCPTNFGLVAALFIQRRTGEAINESSSDANLTSLYCSY